MIPSLTQLVLRVMENIIKTNQLIRTGNTSSSLRWSAKCSASSWYSPQAFVFTTHYMCSLPPPLSDRFMHITCAGVSPLLHRGLYTANNKRTIRSVRRETSLCGTSNQSECKAWCSVSHTLRLIDPNLDMKWGGNISICKPWASTKKDGRLPVWKNSSGITGKGMMEVR